MLDVLYFVSSVFGQTIIQVLRVFGQVILFGFMLYACASLTRSVYAQTLGNKAELFITGWIGTPVHELSHALFCVIFKHRIDDMKLFTTKSKNGVIGYVLHSYDTRSWYQQAGNFFIGVAPIIVGSIVIYILLALLTPNIEKNLLNNVGMQKQNLTNVEGTPLKETIKNKLLYILSLFVSGTTIIKNIISSIITNSELKKPTFWIFLYLAISIASHMELSPADLTHAWKGFIVLFAFMLVVNTVIFFFNLLGVSIPFITNPMRNITSWFTSSFTAVLMLSLIISFFNLTFTFIGLSLLNVIRGKGIVNPFLH